MIRMVGTRIIIPKGDTGFFYLMNKGAHSENDVAVFSVKDPLTRKTVIEKIVDASECGITIEIENEDTRELPAGKYFWDLKLVNFLCLNKIKPMAFYISRYSKSRAKDICLHD